VGDHDSEGGTETSTSLVKTTEVVKETSDRDLDELGEDNRGCERDLVVYVVSPVVREEVDVKILLAARGGDEEVGEVLRAADEILRVVVKRGIRVRWL